MGTHDDKPSAWGEATAEQIELEARRFAVQQKVTRGALRDATFHQGETGDDFLRNQLTQMLEATVYSERVDTSRIDGELEVECDYERVRVWWFWALVLAAWTAGCIAASIGGWVPGLIAGVALGALLIFAERHAIAVHVVTTTVPVSAERITWAAYPDAPIPERVARLGQPIRHVEWGPADYRTPGDS